jgi:hypothetical protein
MAAGMKHSMPFGKPLRKSSAYYFIRSNTWFRKYAVTDRPRSNIRKYKFHPTISGCFQLLANVAQVFGIFVATLTLLFSISAIVRPDPAVAILRRIEHAIITPFEDSPTEVFSQYLSVPSEVTREVTREVTKEVTRIATKVITLLITNTPSPATPTTISSPASLGIDDIFSDDRVSLSLLDVEFNFFAHLGISSADFAIAFEFVFINNSVDELLLRFSKNDFKARDNNGREYSCTVYKNSCLNEDITQPLTQSEDYKFWIVCGRDLVLDTRVSMMTLEVAQFSSLPPTEWIVEVPR